MKLQDIYEHGTYKLQQINENEQKKSEENQNAQMKTEYHEQETKNNEIWPKNNNIITWKTYLSKTPINFKILPFVKDLILAQRLINLEIPVLVRSLKSSNVELG